MKKSIGPFDGGRMVGVVDPSAASAPVDGRSELMVSSGRRPLSSPARSAKLGRRSGNITRLSACRALTSR